MARLGKARLGVCSLACLAASSILVGHGEAWRGRVGPGMVWRGEVWQGLESADRLRLVGSILARQGGAWMGRVGQGEAGRGVAW